MATGTDCSEPATDQKTREAICRPENCILLAKKCSNVLDASSPFDAKRTPQWRCNVSYKCAIDARSVVSWKSRYLERRTRKTSSRCTTMDIFPCQHALYCSRCTRDPKRSSPALLHPHLGGSPATQQQQHLSVTLKKSAFRAPLLVYLLPLDLRPFADATIADTILSSATTSAAWLETARLRDAVTGFTKVVCLE